MLHAKQCKMNITEQTRAKQILQDVIRNYRRNKKDKSGFISSFFRRREKTVCISFPRFSPKAPLEKPLTLAEYRLYCKRLSLARQHLGKHAIDNQFRYLLLKEIRMEQIPSADTSACKQSPQIP